MSIRSIRPVRSGALATLSAVAILTAVPVSATAQCEPDVPSDNSEVGQYLETIPGACGDDSPAGEGDGDEGSGAGGSGPGGDAVGDEIANELESISADGEATAALAESTAPNGGGGGDDSGTGAESQPDNGALDAGADAADGSAAAALGGNISAESSDGVGIVLPLVLGLVLLAGIVYFLRTRARASDT